MVDDAFPVVAVDDGPAPPAPVPSSPSDADSRRLDVVLRVGDGVTIVLAFLAMALSTGYHHLGGDRLAFTLVGATVLGLWAIRFQDLWNERVTAMRTIEISRLSRAAAILGVGMLVIDRLSRAYVHVEQVIVGVVLSWLLLLVWRSFRPRLARPQPAPGPVHSAAHHHRHRPPGGRAGETVRDPPGGGDARAGRDRLPGRGRGGWARRPVAR